MANTKITNSLLDELRNKCRYYSLEHSLNNSELIGVLEILKFDILETCLRDDDDEMEENQWAN